MITSLDGTIKEKSKTYVIVDVRGVGYRVFTSKLQVKKEKVRVFTHLHVGADNQQNLYGFTSLEELELFERLLEVQGIGPKIAQKIIEADKVASIEKAIFSGDITYFTHVKGLGKKGAQKLILELKNVLIEDVFDEGEETVKKALETLGFTKHEINNARKTVSIQGMSDEEAIETILRHLGT